MSYKKSILETKVDNLIDEASIVMREHLTKALKSGAIDLDGYDTDSALLPKILITAFLEETASMYRVSGTNGAMAKKEVENIRLFL